MGECPRIRSLPAGQRFPQVRKWPRFSFSSHGEVIVPPMGDRLTGEVSVISRGGCYFRGGVTQAPNTLVQLKIEHRGAVFQSWARVANAISGEGMGLAFVDVGEIYVGILNQWLAELGRQND
jgi:hypothetical protein